MDETCANHLSCARHELDEHHDRRNDEVRGLPNVKLVRQPLMRVACVGRGRQRLQRVHQQGGQSGDALGISQVYANRMLRRLFLHPGALIGAITGSSEEIGQQIGGLDLGEDLGRPLRRAHACPQPGRRRGVARGHHQVAAQQREEGRHSRSPRPVRWMYTSSRLGRVTCNIGIIDHVLEDVRDLSLSLRPPLLDEAGLAAALRSYFEEQSARTGLVIDFVLEVDNSPCVKANVCGHNNFPRTVANSTLKGFGTKR